MKKKKEIKHQGRSKNRPKALPAAELGQWRTYGVLAVIVLISLIIYLPALHNGLLDWDDEGYIKNNPLIFSINLKHIFSSNVMGNYHPLTILALAIEYHFFGLHETGYHAVNLLLHLLNVILVFHAVLLLSNRTGVALVASLLFGIHPLHVESVAWVAELKDLLYTFFFLAAIIFYSKYLKEKKTKFYAFTLLLFLLSLLSKAMAASLPVVLLLIDYYNGRKINAMVLLEKVPFIALSLILGVAALFIQNSSGAIPDLEIYTFVQRIAFACYGFINYLIKLFLPLHLSAYYPYPLKHGNNIPMQYYLYILLFIGLAVFVFYSLRYSKKIFFAFSFFAATIFLVLQLLPVGGVIMADRYSYIPSIGIFYLAGEGFHLLWSKKLKLPAAILLSIFVIFFSVKTYARCGVWKNGITLWNDVISQTQTASLPYYNRGVNFMTDKKTDLALDDYDKAIELNPNYVKARVNRGNILRDQHKKYDEALRDYNKALQEKPDFVEGYYNRGVLFYYEKKYEEAIGDFSKAIELKPAFAEAYFTRAMSEFDSGRQDSACLDMKKSADLRFQRANDVIPLYCK